MTKVKSLSGASCHSPKKTADISYPIFSFASAALFCCLFSSTCFSTHLLFDGDTLFHIRIGQYLLKARHIPHYDFYSYIQPPLRWLPHEWFSEVLMAIIYCVFGLRGIIASCSLLIALTYTALFCHTKNNNFLASIIAIFFVAMTNWSHWFARPHILTNSLLVIYMIILDRYQNGNKTCLWILPLLSLIWINLHAGFAIGLICIGIYAFTSIIDGSVKHNRLDLRKGKHVAVIFFISLGVSCINPIGVKGVVFPFHITTDAAKIFLANVGEFQALNFQDEIGFRFHFSFLLTVVLLNPRKPYLRDSLLFLLGTYMAFYSKRHVAIFSILTYPLFIYSLKGLMEMDHGARAYLRGLNERVSFVDNTPLLRYLALLLVMGVTSAGICIARPVDLSKVGSKPVEATKFIQREKPYGHMFNNDEFGDYFIYALYPQYQVFFDGRLDMYGSKITEEYINVTHLKAGWEDILQKYQVSWIVDYSGSPLSVVLLRHPGWRLVYIDKLANIFVKNIPENYKLIAKCSKTQISEA